MNQSASVPVTITISGEALTTLQDMARQSGRTIGATLAAAIATEKCLVTERSHGARILIRRKRRFGPGFAWRQLVWPD
jgi:hypothetical protein